ncbi:MAG: DUF692 domain-containing protein [Deltaproteobacteria bacterium]|nr:MAG: DUF692 domain-containing protein [Deltaproteobacteria bacterium]
MTRVEPPRPSDAPFLGVGVGLRPVHYREVLERGAQETLRVDWFEALSENYMAPGGRPRRILGQVRERAPLALHGVSMNLGSIDPLDETYLRGLAELVARVEPAWISDHLCWTGVDGRNLHDLLPLPRTEETLRHVTRRVTRVQNLLGRRIALENVSSYLRFEADAGEEWEFLVAVAEASDCGILLDVNNICVSAHNHGFDPLRYIDAIPSQRVFEIHLAGHSESGPLRIDTHDRAVSEEVWSVYAHAVRRLGRVSTLIEWDDAIPAFPVLEAEAQRARNILHETWREEERDGTAHTRPAAGRCTAPAVASHHGA